MSNQSHHASLVRKCPRIAARPDPSMWTEDELLTLSEAAELMWPAGPIVTSSLRTAARQGQLGIAVIAGKFFTTKKELAVMSRCSTKPPPEIASDSTEAPTKQRILSRAEAAARLAPVRTATSEKTGAAGRRGRTIHKDSNAQD